MVPKRKSNACATDGLEVEREKVFAIHWYNSHRDFHMLCIRYKAVFAWVYRACSLK